MGLMLFRPIRQLEAAQDEIRHMVTHADHPLALTGIAAIPVLAAAVVATLAAV